VAWGVVRPYLRSCSADSILGCPFRAPLDLLKFLSSMAAPMPVQGGGECARLTALRAGVLAVFSISARASSSLLRTSWSLRLRPCSFSSAAVRASNLLSPARERVEFLSWPGVSCARTSAVAPQIRF
jgi:hypothetical protein